MSLGHALTPLLSRVLTSPGLRTCVHTLRDALRRLRGRGHRADFFFRVDDPWSWLLAQVLPEFASHFNLTVRPRLMLYLDEQMYPAMDMLAELAPRDARRLAQVHELEFPEQWVRPDAEAALLATRVLLRHEHDPAFFRIAHGLCRALWNGDHEVLRALAAEYGTMPADQTRLELEARRDGFLREGHYLTATLHYEGEWYWSIERLDHLAGRLLRSGAARTPPPRDYQRAKKATLAKKPATGQDHSLELFFSFRSPYSWIALARTFRLVDHYQIALHIRPVLPMIMRGLSVPRAKRLYILHDAAREAQLHDVPFGTICDPLGPGVERCMALWPFAEKEGRLREWLLAAGTGIWARGINPATDRGLRRLCDHAGLNWHRARRWLDDDGWCERAEENRREMTKAGSWGVPAFRVDNDGEILWGQDRFGVLERLLTEDNRAETPSSRKTAGDYC